MLHLEKNLHHLPIIDRGESDVFRYDDTHVLKRYSGFAVGTICLYQHMTNDIARILNGRRIELRLSHPPICAAFPYRVVPIEHVLVDQQNNPCTISEYIPGPQLYSLIQEGGMHAPGYYSDPLRTLASYDKMIFFRTLETLNRDLQFAIRNPNVLLTPVNMKIVDNTWVVTDVASNVRLLATFRGFIGHYL